MVSIILLLGQRGFGQMVQKRISQVGPIDNQIIVVIVHIIIFQVVITNGMTQVATFKVEEFTKCPRQAFVMLPVKDTHATKLIVQVALHQITVKVRHFPVESDPQ